MSPTKISGLWRNTSANGKVYYSGKIGNTRLMIFKNERREGHDKDPDLTLMVAKVDDNLEWTRFPLAEDEARPTAKAPGYAAKASHTPRRDHQPDEPDIDVPF